MSSEAIPLRYVNARDYELHHLEYERYEELRLAAAAIKNEKELTVPLENVEIMAENLKNKLICEEMKNEVVVPLNKSSKNNESESSKVTTTTTTTLTTTPSTTTNKQPPADDVVTSRKFSSSASNDILASIESQLNIIMPIHSKKFGQKLLDSDETAPASEAEDELKPLKIDNHSPPLSDTAQHKNEKPIVFNANAPVFNPSNRVAQFISQLQEKRDSFDSNCSDESFFDNRQKMYLASLNSGKISPTEEEIPDVLEIDTIEFSQMPTDKFAEDIVEQVEFYFSNESILKDAFLLKHVRRNKEGYVSLKLVSSFKRVRQLTKDWRVVGQAIRRKGHYIELNEICTKVRRVDPLPNFDETMPSRTIVACDLPIEKMTIEKVSDIFARCGEIALIRILKPGMGIPVDVRQFMNKYPEMQEKECALVEFQESNSARNAKNLPYLIFDMVAPKKKTGRKSITPNSVEGRMAKVVESYKIYEHPHYNHDRNRGGSFSVQQPTVHQDQPPKYSKPHYYHQAHPQQQAAQHIFQRNNSYVPMNDNYSRRCSNGSVTMLDDRRFSSCSEGYSSYSDTSRRPSGYSSTDDSRRNSGACSEHCSCSSSGQRRLSQGSDVYRRLSNGSDCGRRFSNSNSAQLPERSYSNPTSEAFQARRKESMDSNYDRKLSIGSQGSMCESLNSFHNFQNYRKCSNGFDRKLPYDSATYISGRRLSSDSGYDRRMSYGSDSENFGSPRTRTGSFLANGSHNKCSDNLVRTPIGPDGSKGFTSRARKFGQIVPPVN